MKFTKVGIALVCVASQAAFATGIPTVVDARIKLTHFR